LNLIKIGATYSDQQQEDDDAEFFAESNNNYHHQNEIESELERNIENISVKIGQHATLPCFVQNLGSFKVQSITRINKTYITYMPMTM
jgi:hypothetical protein